MKAKSKVVTNYWCEFYSNKFCSLCANHGVIDTRGLKMKMLDGEEVGRLNWCICPNGQAMRNHYDGLPTEEHLR